MANLDKIQNNEKLFYFSVIFLAFVLPTPGVFISRTGFNSVFPLLDPCPCPPCRSGYRRSPVMRTRIRNTVFDKYFLTVLLTICLVVVFCAEATWRALWGSCPRSLPNISAPRQWGPQRGPPSRRPESEGRRYARSGGGWPVQCVHPCLRLNKF